MKLFITIDMWCFFLCLLGIFIDCEIDECMSQDINLVLFLFLIEVVSLDKHLDLHTQVYYRLSLLLSEV